MKQAFSGQTHLSQPYACIPLRFAASRGCRYRTARRRNPFKTRAFRDVCSPPLLLNPCPCGYYGDLKRECRCTPNQIIKYRQRISGPLLDRIDIHVEVPLIDYKEFSSDTPGEASAPIRERVENARALQTTRYAGHGNVSCNAALPPKLMKEHCAIDAESRALMEQAMTELNFSARAHDRILKVARTLADLDGGGSIEANHVLEAIQYRSLDRNLWE